MVIRLDNTSAFLKDSLEELKNELGIVLSDKDGFLLSVQKADKFEICKTDESIKIFYSDKVQIFKGLKYAVNNGSKRFDTNFKELGVMLDCSRNAVLNLTFLKKMARKFALLGYNNIQLYTEDTFEITGQPYFGHLRGRYTVEEIKDYQNYCDLFGIELIPCVQTLAHFTALFKWKHYGEINDVFDILLAENEKTYEFLDSMFKSLRSCFKSDKINIGMDEAHLIGSGKYFDKSGYKDRYLILLDHLKFVTKLCEKYNFKPMMWSDMFFRTVNNNEYYIDPQKDFVFPQKIIDAVPKDVTLVYWDYYGCNTSRYEKMLSCHMQFNNKIAFAGGSWKWLGFAPNNNFSLKTSYFALSAMKKYPIDTVLVTCWGDNGAEGSASSVFAALAMYSSYCYNSVYDKEAANRELKTYLDEDIEDYLALDYPNMIDGNYMDNMQVNPSKYFLYNDSLLGLFDYYAKDGFNEKYLSYAKKLEKLSEKNKDSGYVFDTLSKLCYVLSIKCELGVKIKSAYKNKAKAELAALVKDLDTLDIYFDEFVSAFKKQWKIENKAFGREVIDLRLAGVKERLHAAKDKIIKYLTGEEECVEELEADSLPYAIDASGNKNQITVYRFDQIFTPSVL